MDYIHMSGTGYFLISDPQRKKVGSQVEKWCSKSTKAIGSQKGLRNKPCTQNHMDKQNSTIELGHMHLRGLSDPKAVTVSKY